MLAERTSRRFGAALVALAGAAALIDDVCNGVRLWRRLWSPRRSTTNVVAEAGSQDGDGTLVVLAHHDAAPTGAVFDQRPQAWLARRFPGLIERTDTSAPLWWPVAGAPLLVAAGAASGWRVLTRAGLALEVAICAMALDVLRSPIVPGANDNLSAVAALVGLAERLRAAPPRRIRVLLVSCGAEEVIQGGIYAFARSHFPQLDPSRTWFLNLETIGSPELVLVEGEGPFGVRDYPAPAFRDLIAAVAARTARPLRRGIRLRVSTDAVVPSHAGYATATFGSWDPATKLAGNYHLLSDRPENLHFQTIARAVDLIAALVAELDDASAAWPVEPPSRSRRAVTSTYS